MRKLGIYKDYPCYVVTLKEYEEKHEDSIVYVVCDPGEGFDVNEPRKYAMVLNGMKIAVWDGKYARKCQEEEFAVSGQKVEKTRVNADMGHENGNFSEYSAVVDEFFKNLTI